MLTDQPLLGKNGDSMHMYPDKGELKTVRCTWSHGAVKAAKGDVSYGAMNRRMEASRFLSQTGVKTLKDKD